MIRKNMVGQNRKLAALHPGPRHNATDALQARIELDDVCPLLIVDDEVETENAFESRVGEDVADRHGHVTNLGNDPRSYLAVRKDIVAAVSSPTRGQTRYSDQFPGKIRSDRAFAQRATADGNQLARHEGRHLEYFPGVLPKQRL